MITIDKKTALDCYKTIITEQGKHTGRWENEYIREDSSMRYFEEMTDMVDYLNLNFSHDPYDYLDGYDDDDYNYIEDVAGFELFEKLENILRGIILND